MMKYVFYNGIKMTRAQMYEKMNNLTNGGF
jgi:uncharacterized protein (DUF2164 family)